MKSRLIESRKTRISDISQQKKIVTLKEYEGLCKHTDGKGLVYQYLNEHAFDQLEQFILENKGGDQGTDALEFLSVTSRRGIGKLISAKNYVGIITMAQGTQVEILPKVFDQNNESSDEETKRIFLHMLSVTGEIPYKIFRQSGLHTERHTIFDIFIRMFINEANRLVKHGLKSNYVVHQGNEQFLKGKLQFTEHIKHNAAHTERFYIQYDLFSVNRPENSLIKSTIELLLKISAGSRNKKDLHILLNSFDQVESSLNWKLDWSSVTMDRSNKEYRTIMEWCRVFLLGHSFTPFRGDGAAYALLFPMEKIFERYVAVLLRKSLAPEGLKVRTQDQSQHLFQSPSRFNLRPDIVVEGNGKVVVLDTKWKLLTSRPDYGISQADMYQAYVYAKKYGARTVYLLYPWHPGLSRINEPVVYDSGDGVNVKIGFIDLSLGKESVYKIIESMLETMK
ncbi:McrC family protein [Paenibacillus sp. FSL H8-0079]|uniref:McrC family protein n=1 Tax=Paenibacillus sp. FSL H8-0079 TaxID=2921375 RepID=UPI0030EE3004